MTAARPGILTVIGAGSAVFSRSLVLDLIADGGEWELRLVDTAPRPLEIAHRLADRLVEACGARIHVRAALDRRRLLGGSDAVITTIGVGGRRAWEQDVFIPRRFGIHVPVGDTAGPGGISRALRMAPVLVEIARDVAELCPAAAFLNYSNPMAVNCRAVARETDLSVAGLCAGVRNTHRHLADLLGVAPELLESRAVGINHFTWITELRLGGEDAWPQVRVRLPSRPDRIEEDPLSWELFDLFGALPAPLDRHVAEFIPGWHGKGAYYGRTLGVDAHSLERTIADGDAAYQAMVEQAEGRQPLQTDAGDHNDAIPILRALWGEAPPDLYSVNLPNAGQVSNLPARVVVEGTARVDSAGFHPLGFGAIPPGMAALLQREIAVQELTVEAAFAGDRELVVQAMLADGRVTAPADARALTDTLLAAHREWLPRFAS